MESRKLLKGIKMKEYLYVNSEYLKICISGGTWNQITITLARSAVQQTWRQKEP